MGRAGKTAIAVIISLLTTSLGGCAGGADIVAGEGHLTTALSMESTPIIDYTVPQVTSNVLVDRLGYQADGDKEAAVKGRELPEEFRLVDADTGEVVYWGEIEKVTYNTESELCVGNAVFDDYEEAGTYYLECDGIGRSYTFTIEPDFYRKLFEEMSEKVLWKCEQKTVSVSEVTALLTAYEWYPELFADKDENEIPDVLEELAQWFGDSERFDEESQEGVLQAALLAKFSYLYQKYDKPYATTCLQKASAMFEQTQNTMRKDAESFFALTELYRASGLSAYRRQILDYKTYFENSGSYLEEPEYLYGAMTYMVTRQKVDINLCNTFMERMMERGEEVSRIHKELIHPVAAKNNGTEDILKRANEIIFVNYVLNSYQYNNILKDFLHYLGGRNLQSITFYTDEGDYTGYILLLAQLAASQENE